MKSGIVFLLFLSFSLITKGQEFNWEAKIGPVEEEGFYNILLTPDITTHINENFSDLRLYDQKEREIGYLLRAEEPVFLQEFKEYKIVENIVKKNFCSHLILENTLKSNINNILLKIRNSDADKKARLTGSDDGENWYIIKENYNLVSLHETEQVSKVVQLHFPLSNYQFYKLEIIDSTTAPLQILSAGYFDTYKEEAKYLSMPGLAITQKDSSDKKSYVRLSFPSNQFVHKISFKCEGPHPYFREAVLYSIDTSNKKTHTATVQNITFKSGQQHTFHLPGVFTKEFLLVIDNHDNIPLNIKTAEAYQLMHYLTANLEKKESYLLKFGNSNLTYPQYDLEYFRDSLAAIERVISPTDIKNTPAAISEKPQKGQADSLWIWLSIGGIGILLAFMSVKMIREMKG